MHKRPIHNWHRLQKVRQHLTQVVTILEWRNRRQYNIHLDEQFIAGVVGAQILNLSNGRCKTHSKVQ